MTRNVTSSNEFGEMWKGCLQLEQLQNCAHLRNPIGDQSHFLYIFLRREWLSFVQLKFGTETNKSTLNKLIVNSEKFIFEKV